MKQTIRITESELRSMIQEAVSDAIEGEETSPADRLGNLRKQSRTYRGHDSNPNKMNKTFNRGMGSLEFIQIIPEENVLLVNKNLAKRRDIERIEQAFPEYKIEMVSLGYPDYYFKGLSSMRGK